MTLRLGVVMDAIDRIHYKKDSTLGMLWEAARRGFEINYFEQQDLYLLNSVPYGQGRLLKVREDEHQWFEFLNTASVPLADLDIILMRKDPPFNAEYIYSTYILEHAERLGTLVVNRPQALRDANEKLFATSFPTCIPPSIVTQSLDKLREFWHQHGEIVCKPLDSMGGEAVFRLHEQDVNANVVFEVLTHHGTRHIMAQQFIPAIKDGDKRIILIDGEPIPHALVRVPQGADWRGNLAVGAKGKIQPLTRRDHFICEQLAPSFRERGLFFVGIDVIGDYLTEINVTSPTGIRELDAALDINISAKLFDCLLKKLKK